MSAKETAGEYRAADEVAQFIGVTPRRVRQLADEGVIPKGDRGRYHFVGAIKGYIKYLQQRAEGRSTDDAPAIEQRERYARLQADRVEMEIAEKRGELVSRAGVHSAWSVKLISAAEQFQGIPDRLSAVLAAESKPHVCHQLIREEVLRCMTILSTPPGGMPPRPTHRPDH